MQALSALPFEVAANVRAVFTDIDDTLTLHGRLPASAYAAMERLQQAGIAVVPVTGRPAGWCDLIARQWPVAGVVGENGAFYFAYDERSHRMRRVYAQSAAERAQGRDRLRELAHRILAEVPGAALSADQAYREADLAIDFCEDVPPLPQAQIERIVDLFGSVGAVAKVSSIHVNGWFGHYDKLGMSRRLAHEILDLDIDTQRDEILFVGDSPNDAPMFGHFPHACAVANVRGFADQMRHLPAYVADSEGGCGFVEVVDRVLSARPG